MKKIQTPVRSADEASVRTDSFTSQSGYWTEGEAYEISALQAEELRTSALSLVRLYNNTMDLVTSDISYSDQFVFTGNKRDDRKIFKFACEQWKEEKQKGYVMDRWDIAWDGVSPPKLLERNFGNIGLIAGTASVQEDYVHWLSKQPSYGDIGTFNNLQSSFISAFRHVANECGIPVNSRIALTTDQPKPTSDQGMIRAYEILCRWIKRAGYDPVQLEIQNLVYTGETDAYIDPPKHLEEMWQQQLGYNGLKGFIQDIFATIRISQSYCYPFTYFENYARERALYSKQAPRHKRLPTDFLDTLLDTGRENNEVIMMSPYSSLLIGHKAMLPILYRHNPNHPNLLPSYFNAEPLSGSKYITKIINSGQGHGSRIISENGELIASRYFKKGQDKLPYRNIYQQYAPGCIDENEGFRVFHLFTTNGTPAALGARVAPNAFVGGDDTQTRYVPVLVRNDPKKPRRIIEKNI